MKKHIISNVIITPEDITKRTISISPNSHNDYITESYRRMFPVGQKLSIENQIFEERLGICLKETSLALEIINCEFKKGFFVRRGEKDVDYDIFIYKCNISDSLVLHSFEAMNKVSIHNSIVEYIIISGKSEIVDFYRADVEKLELEFLRCAKFSMELSDIHIYSLYKFSSAEVEFDTDDIAISDYSRFAERSDQSKKQTSEVYHRFVLKAVKTIKASRAVNYQLTKATTSWLGIFFGYFYKPLHILFWILCVVIIYSAFYSLILGKCFIESLYFSSYTFLTIGYGDIDEKKNFYKDNLGFFRGTYRYSLCSSIIDISNKFLEKIKKLSAIASYTAIGFQCFVDRKLVI